jgi:DNA-binding transcriptional ArsR family regulator
MKTMDNVWWQVERGLGSAGRLRILRALASKEEASQTRYSLERVTGLKPIDVRKHLQVLIDTGWVKEHDVNPPVYTLNLDDPKAQWLVDFLEKMSCL